METFEITDHYITLDATFGELVAFQISTGNSMPLGTNVKISLSLQGEVTSAIYQVTRFPEVPSELYSKSFEISQVEHFAIQAAGGIGIIDLRDIQSVVGFNLFGNDIYVEVTTDQLVIHTTSEDSPHFQETSYSKN